MQSNPSIFSPPLIFFLSELILICVGSSIHMSASTAESKSEVGPTPNDPKCHVCNPSLPPEPQAPKCWHYCDAHCFQCTHLGRLFCETHREKYVGPRFRQPPPSKRKRSEEDGKVLPPEYDAGQVSAKRAHQELTFHLARASAIAAFLETCLPPPPGLIASLPTFS